MQMYFDFTKDATRASITNQLRAKLDDAGWAAITTEAMRAGVPKGHHRNIAEVRRTIESLRMSRKVKEDMLAVYEILASAEAQVHGCEVEETHFHEVGEGQAIFNTLLICSLFSYVHPNYVIATSVQTGSGQIECAHGLMDIPAPATAAIRGCCLPAGT